MNRDILEGNWRQLKGSIKVRWSRLSHDHFGVIDGQYMQATGLTQTLNGINRDRLRHKERRTMG